LGENAYLTAKTKYSPDRHYRRLITVFRKSTRGE
jgi:hypothetical protein